MENLSKNLKKSKNNYAKKERASRRAHFFSDAVGSFTALSIEYLYLFNNNNK